MSFWPLLAVAMVIGSPKGGSVVAASDECVAPANIARPCLPGPFTRIRGPGRAVPKVPEPTSVTNGTFGTPYPVAFQLQQTQHGRSGQWLEPSM